MEATINQTFFHGIRMKTIKLELSDGAFSTIKDLVFVSQLGDNYGGCQQAWKKVIDAILDGEESVEIKTKEEREKE